MIWVLTILVLSAVYEAKCDYMCACVFTAEKSVYVTNSTVANVLGLLYEFDCKPTANTNHDDKWIAIQFEHKIGFIEADQQTEVRNCTGALPGADLVTISTPIVVTIATQAPSYTVVVNTVDTGTLISATTGTATSTSSSFVQGHVELCPPRIQQLASRHGVTLGQYGHSCYEVVQGGVAWEHAEAACVKNGGHLAHIANQQEQDFIHNFLIKHQSHVVWIGLQDRQSEEHFSWSSGDSMNYTNWAPGRQSFLHDREDCVYMTPDTGLWNDVECGINLPIVELIGSTHGYICQFDTVDRSPDGDITKCPDTARLQAAKNGGFLGQYGNSCYELNTHRYSWTVAEGFCESSGGHLAHITSADEQSYIQSFMVRHSPQNAAWIGLTDTSTEGTFQWISGQPVRYTNWASGHVGNVASSNEEDCVLFSPFHSGQWDDIPCDKTGGGFLFINLGTTYRYESICQYNIGQSLQVIG